MSEGKDLFQNLFEAAVNHYSKEAIVHALNFIAELSEDDLKEWTVAMSPRDAARCYAVWRASKSVEKMSNAELATVVENG